MNKIIFSALTLCLGLLVSTQARAEDQTLQAQGCKTSLGTTSTSGNALIATGGTAVVSCYITKKTGYNNLSTVWVRLDKSSSFYLPITVTSLSSYNTSGSTGSGAATGDQSGNLSISVPVPATVHSNGYLIVTVVLGEGDRFHGVRWVES